MDNNEIKLLSDVANIVLGLLFRVKPSYVRDGGMPVIQLKDISWQGRIDWAGLSRVQVGSVNPRFLLKEGDILVKTKGDRHNAVVMPKIENSLIFTSQLVMLRVKKPEMLSPAYLAWYINEPAQPYITQVSAGTKIQNLSVNGLSKLPIEVPPIDVQRKIVRLLELQRTEKELVHGILDRREKIIRSLLLSKFETIVVTKEKLK